MLPTGEQREKQKKPAVAQRAKQEVEHSLAHNDDPCAWCCGAGVGLGVASMVDFGESAATVTLPAIYIAPHFGRAEMRRA